MIEPLTDQLRDYFRYVEELADDRVAIEPIAVLADEPVELLPWPEDPGPVDDRENNMNRNRWGIIALAAALVVIVGLVVVAGGGDDPVSTTDLADTPTTEPTVMPSVEAALATIEQWYEAVDAGDAELMSAFYKEMHPDDLSGISMRDSEIRLAVWKAAQGSMNTDMTCTGEETDRSFFVITCTYLNQPRIRELVGAEPEEVTDTITMESEGRIALTSTEYASSPDAYADVHEPFLEWMELEFPDDAAAVDCCGWESIDDARERGELRLHYAQLWAAYLEENGCTYDAPCP